MISRGDLCVYNLQLTVYKPLDYSGLDDGTSGKSAPDLCNRTVNWTAALRPRNPRHTLSPKLSSKKMVQYLNPSSAPPAQGLYSQASYSDTAQLYFIAGQLSVGDSGEVVGPDSFEQQFNRVLFNLDNVLRGLGRAYRDVLKFTTYLADAEYISKFMELRAARFRELYGDGAFPPNTLVVVKRLVKPEFKLEIEAIVQGAK